MIRSPGDAASMALWIVPLGRTCVGILPPTVTVTLSMDCLPLVAVITISPHSAGDPPYCACCWMLQAGTLAGTAATICESLHEFIAAVTPPMVTVPCVEPKP